MSQTVTYPYGNIDPNSLLKPFSWEQFDFIFWRKWMSQNFHYPMILSSTYVVLVFLGKFWMRNRPPKKLRSSLIVWNLAFTLFSLAALVRTAPDLFHALSHGFHHSVCSSEGQSLPFAFWSWIGTLSKIVELGDTAFVVLRKKELIFLHYYHHAATLLYTWFIFESQEPCHRWLMTMNYFIHVLMYSYYGLHAAGVKLPKMFSILITTLQILQMGIGLVINYYTMNVLANNQPCDRSESNVKLAFGLYASYLILFINFYYQSYLNKAKKTKKAD